MSVAAMQEFAAHQNFRGVPIVTPQDDEAAFGKVDVQGTGLVDKRELVVSLREMGKPEREIQRLLDMVSVHKELVTPLHNVDVPMVSLWRRHDGRSHV